VFAAIIMFLAPLGYTEIEQKYLVISPMTLELSWQTESEILAKKKMQNTIEHSIIGDKEITMFYVIEPFTQKARVKTEVRYITNSL